MPNARERHLEQMKELELELSSDDCSNKEALIKELKRMKTQLMEYDRWHKLSEVRE